LKKISYSIALLVILSWLGCGGGGQSSQTTPSFNLSASPNSLSVAQGNSGSSTVTVNPLSGFTGGVTLAVTSTLPSGVTATFGTSPTSLTSTLTLAVGNSATTGGPTTVTISGTSGTLTASTTVSLTITAANTVVTVTPSLAAVVVTTQTQLFTTTVTGNSNTQVTWSVDGVAGGSTAVGTINTSGLYSPPATAGTHTVTATSVAVPASSGSANIAVTDLAGVFTHHNDLSRDGVNSQEYALTPQTVNTTTFGKLFSCPVDGAIYTQPLWVPSLSIAGGVHNVIFVATQHDSAYAFDADASPCVSYWQVNLLDALHGGTSGESSITWSDVGSCSGDIYPEVGVTGTPVIDPATNTLYLVSASVVSSTVSGSCPASQGTFYQRLHALDLATGNENFSAPIEISASVTGTGDGGSQDVFNPQMENQRLGLALTNETVYIGWSSHEDQSPWHGWLIGYSVVNSALQQVAAFNSTPNSQAGGIWASGGAPAVDSSGNIYISTGNGEFDELPPPPGSDYGDSVLQLAPVQGSTSNGTGLNIADYFTPEDQYCLSGEDIDLGSGAPMIMPDQTSGPVPNLLVQIGKDGMVYLINRNSMGYYQSPPNSNNPSCPEPDVNSQIVQTFEGSPSGFYGTPAFWQNNLYFAGSLDGGEGDYVKQFSFDATTGQFNSNWTSQSVHYFNFPGVTPSISAQGTSNGIVWALDESAYGYANQNAGSVNCFSAPQVPPSACFGPAILFAYDATNLNDLWDSTMAANNRDQAGNAVKFVPPTVANGKVYVSTRTEVDVYGLLP
jgi:hypothetical protein